MRFQGQNPPGKKSRRYVRGAILFVAGLAVTAIVVYYNGTEKIYLLLRFSFRGMSAVFFFGILSYVSAGLRWGMLVNAFCRRQVMSRFKYIYYHVMAMYSGMFISLLGANFVAKPVLLKVRENVSIESGFVIAVVEKITDTMVIVPAFIVSVYMLNNSIFHFEWLVGLYVMGVFLFCYFHRTVFKFMACLYMRLTGILKSKKVLRVEVNWTVDEITRKIEGIRIPIGSLVGLSVLRYLSILLMLYSIADMYQLEIGIIAFVIGTPIMMAGMVFSFLPASLGIVETGWAVILKLIGINGPDIGVFVVANRIWPMLVIVIAFGILTLIKGRVIDPKR